MHIGVVGVGAVGSFVVSQLLPKYKLSFFNRTEKSVINLKSFYKNIEIPIVLSKPIQNDTVFDWLIICVKEHQTIDVVKTVKQLVKPNTKIAVVRNGMQLQDPFLEFVSEDFILPCIIDCSIQPDDSFVYHQKSEAYIITPNNMLADEFQKLFSRFVIHFETSDDFHTQLWKKLIESSAVGGVMALTKRSCEVFDETQYLSMFQQLVREGINVAKADKANLPFYFYNELNQKVLNYPKDKGSSMLTDVLAGRPIELGAKNGYISKLGKRYKIDTIEHDKIVKALTADD